MGDRIVAAILPVGLHQRMRRIPRLRTMPLLALLVAFSLTTTACLSNEYVISQPELQRLAALPPSQRGTSVHVVQAFGDRRDPAVEASEVVVEETPGDGAYDGRDLLVEPDENSAPDGNRSIDINVQLNGGRGHLAPSHGSSGGGIAVRPPRAGAPWPGPRGPGAGIRPGGGGGGIRSGGGGFKGIGGGGGGGGGGGDALVVIAVIIVAVAIMATVGLVVTEGIRYDGFVELHPKQPLYLKQLNGIERSVELASLTAADAAASEKAVVKDDEWYGFRFDHRRALDRKGAAFKADFGSLASTCACYSAVGLASTIQLGFFPHHRLGLLGTVALGGGKDALSQTFQRHSVGLEAQYFPLDLWRFHLGGFGHGGMQVARDEYGTRSGAAWGGGAILEVSLTTRLALMGRLDYTTARTAPDGIGWAGQTTFGAGIAIY